MKPTESWLTIINKKAVTDKRHCLFLSLNSGQSLERGLQPVKQEKTITTEPVLAENRA